MNSIRDQKKVKKGTMDNLDSLLSTEGTEATARLIFKGVRPGIVIGSER